MAKGKWEPTEEEITLWKDATNRHKVIAAYRARVGHVGLIQLVELFEARTGMKLRTKQDLPIEGKIGEGLNFDLRNHTRGEVIAKIQELGDPRLQPLVRWIAESIEFTKLTQEVRVKIVDAERPVEELGNNVTQRD